LEVCPKLRSAAAPRYRRRVTDRLRAAIAALNAGDAAPFASLFAPDAEWRGVSRGVLWWRDAPS
jgi:ketosteroid isomerase-like protein